MPEFPTREMLESAEPGLSGADRIGSSPIEGVEKAPDVPALTLGEQLRAIAARAVPLAAKIARAGVIKASRDVADPTAIEATEKGAAGGVAAHDDLTAHLSDLVDAHDAANVSYAGSTGLQSADVEAALDELDGEKAPLVHRHDNATTLADGFHSKEDKARVHDRLHGLGSQDHSDVRNGPQDGQVQVFRFAGPGGMGYYHESPGAASVPNATETEAGKAEKATRADYDANTDQGTSGPLYVPVTLLKALLTPEVWTAPPLANGWINSGGALQVAQYRKEPLGVVRLRGFVKSGTTGTATPILTLPVGYRPPADLLIPVENNGSMTNVFLQSTGEVSVVAAASNVRVGLNVTFAV